MFIIILQLIAAYLILINIDTILEVIATLIVFFVYMLPVLIVTLLVSAAL